MREKFAFFINKLNSTSTIEEIETVCKYFFAGFGFEKFIYGTRMLTSFASPNVFIVNSYPEKWKKRYIEENYIE